MRLVSILMVVLLLLAGCASSTPVPEDDDTLGKDQVEVDATTGAIRGVVVDQTIAPVAGATVTAVGAGSEWTATSDADGIFVFNKMAPGPYSLTTTHQFFTEAQSMVTVVAGEATPLVRMQIDQLFNAQPYIVPETFSGYFQCAYNLGAAVTGVSSTCVNDYTRICSVSPPCCPGGCAPELAGAVDKREYVTAIEADWSTIQVELTWEPSLAGTASTMGMVVSYKGRVGAQHNWGSFSGEDHVIGRIDVAARGGTEEEFPDKIPYSGIEDLFIFMAAGSPGVGANVAISQNFDIYQHVSYVAPLPEGWSFVGGDDYPF